MPLQNRVTPFGDIVAFSALTLASMQLGRMRSSQVRRWIACRTEFRGRHRVVMRPRSYTELFFLDEATALSAGHRPCAECRHADYQRFRSLWESCHGAHASADAMDAQLHAERLNGRKKRTYRGALADGTFVVLEGAAWLVWGSELLAWSGSGYVERRPRPMQREADVLTPRSTVAVLAAGYRPSVHPSA